MKKYGLTQKQKDYRKRYYQSPHGKIVLMRNQLKTSYKGYCKRYAKNYYHTPTGKMVIRGVRARRKRNLSFIPIMDNPFPKEIKVDYHHINDIFVIPTPMKLHRKTLGKKHRNKSNQLLNRLGFNINIFNQGGE